MKKEHAVADWNVFYSYVSAHLVCREKIQQQLCSRAVAPLLLCYYVNSFRTVVNE